MINYTKEQQQAIDIMDSDLIISASAGSGKTQVLLEKVVKLVGKGVDLDNMLIVTFTNLAAAEMKTKLENLLESKFRETDDNKFFDAIKKLNSANISTIHSFCQKLVKKYYYELKIDPNFEIKDENFLFYLKNLALDKTIEEYLQNNDEEFLKLSSLFVYKRDYKVFKDEIFSFYDFLISKVDKYNFCENIIEKNYNVNLKENELLEKFKNYVLKIFDNFKIDLKKILVECENLPEEKLINLCNEILNLISLDFVSTENFIKTFMSDFSFPRIQLSNKSEIEAVICKENLQNLVKQIKDTIKTIKNVFSFDNLKEMEESINVSKKLLLKFVEIIKTFEDKFNDLKRKNNCLDFNDLETLTLKLLKNENILDEIASKFKFIFVDEYQDTNFVQEEILKTISKHAKRIMVGDLKQSIYAFRECNPKILNDKMKDFLTNNTGKVVELNKNFRSRKEILEFSNNIFSNLMRNENCDYDYSSRAMFVCGRNDEQNAQKPINIICINKQSDDVLDSKLDENIAILNSINNLLNSKIIENGVERNLEYKDIAIISRKRNERFNDLCKFLEDNKVPTSVKFYEKIYKEFEIKLIFAYLKILNNKNNEISLYSVLKNIYDLTDNDLLTIKNNNFVENVFNYNKNDVILNKIDRFKADFEYFKNKVYEVDVKTLIKEIIKKTNLELILSKTFGKISVNRIDVFLSNLTDDIFDLSQFLSYSEKITDKKFEVKKSSGENSVVIDTFHSTKGLEYNAVIIAFAGDGLFAKNKSNLIYNANLGIGIYNFDEESRTKSPNIIYSIIKILNKQEEFNEEVRLSYVAFTRAKNYMTICGTCKTDNLKVESNVNKFLNFSSYLDLIFSVPISDFVDYTIINEDLFSENKDEEIVKDKETLTLDYKIFDKMFNFSYPYEKSRLIQEKNSVTSLSEEDNLIYNITNFKVTDEDKEDFIAVGNAYHHTFEKIKFSLNDEKEVHNSIVNLIENNELESNVYSYIDDKKIFKAISSIKNLITPGDKIYKEKVFLMNVRYDEITGKESKDKILIQGIIDLIIEKEDEIILIDYKTSRLNSINLIKKYSLQLNLYEKAISEKYPNKKITKYIYSIFLDKLINVV